MSFTLAVSAEMVFLDLPIAERVRRIHDAGFAAEIWNWTKHDLAELAATGAHFTSMTGYVSGDLIDPDGADTLLATARESVAASRALGRPKLNLHGTGLDDRGLPVKPVDVVSGEMWLAAESDAAPDRRAGRGRRTSSSPSRTSTSRSTTPARRSPAPPTPTPWCAPSTARTCG